MMFDEKLKIKLYVIFKIECKNFKLNVKILNFTLFGIKKKKLNKSSLFERLLI